MFPILQWKTIARLLSGAGVMGLAGLDVSAEVEVGISADAAYLKHECKPLLAVWGIGFDEGLPSDFYLRLDGVGAKMSRGEIPASEQLPVR